MKNYEDKIYSLGETVTGQTQDRHRPCHQAITENTGK